MPFWRLNDFIALSLSSCGCGCACACVRCCSRSSSISSISSTRCCSDKRTNSSPFSCKIVSTFCLPSPNQFKLSNEGLALDYSRWTKTTHHHEAHHALTCNKMTVLTAFALNQHNSFFISEFADGFGVPCSAMLKQGLVADTTLHIRSHIHSNHAHTLHANETNNRGSTEPSCCALEDVEYSLFKVYRKSES